MEYRKIILGLDLNDWDNYVEYYRIEKREEYE
jgi:hypothetical protein